jgi:tRNA pseudouridine38-40 synthase
LDYAGLGKIKPHDIKDIIKSCDRKNAGITAPPQGLYLSEVYY